jgi:hypothetical protein
MPPPKINEDGECTSQPNPNQCPSLRLAKLHCMARALQEPQIEYQHAQHEKVEENPEE